MIVSQEGVLYILLIILGVCIANLYGLRRIIILERKIMTLEALITKKLLRAKPARKTVKKKKRKR